MSIKYLALILSIILRCTIAMSCIREIDKVVQNKIILCTGPSLGRREILKLNIERDMQLIPYKKIYLCTNDPKNLDLTFGDQIPICELIETRNKQLDCLNCIISTINSAINDKDCKDDDIIIFKHESVFINDMNLVRQAIGKILDGYDMVIKYWIGFESIPSTSLKDYFHTDSFYLKVGSARQFLKNHPLVLNFTSDYQFCEEYFTKHIVSKLPAVYKIEYQHSSWKDNELGFYHIPSRYEDPSWYWDKKNYDEIYKKN